MDNNVLQERFAALQAEQKRKLMMVQQRKSQQKAAPKTAPVEDTSFGISDDLSLNMSDVMSSSTVGLNVTLEAANATMRDEIRELRDETGRLRKVLAEKEYNVQRLSKKFIKLEEEKRMLSEAGVASDAASTKIVDLSKKNRELTAVMESEKSKCVRLQQKVKDLEMKLENSPKSDDNKQSPYRQSYPTGSPRVSNEELQEQLSSANLKIADYRNQVQSLKQEMKVAMKVLSQEIGETPDNLQQLLSSGAQGFRGRAQQVVALQGKVRDLEQKVKGSSSPKEDKNLIRIKNMERMRKEQNDTLKEDLSKLQEQCSDYQRKWEASKARVKILTGEVKSLKAQIGVLTDKGSHDNELITTLTKQQDRLQKLMERNAANQREQSQDERKTMKVHYERQQQESTQLNHLKQLLGESEKRVAELEEKLIQKSGEPDNDNDTKFKPLAVFSPPAAQPTAQSKSTSEVKSNDPQIVDLRRKVAEIEALFKASEIERQKLAELVAILNKRLQEAISRAETTRSNLHAEQKKNATLQQQLDASGHMTDGGGTSRGECFDSVDSLRSQLAIQVDENHALKEALERTLHSKQEDVALYNEMSEQTKHVFLDALRSFGST